CGHITHLCLVIVAVVGVYGLSWGSTGPGTHCARHVEEVDKLITSWRGQRAINLPGRVVARRQGGRLVIRQS
ncbi:TilS substrate-binding domain-containing protein, partial [Streptomyces hundungensis]|uniref:TilS substrate-binding domain-containing protein n=1 Tax=Streptomyces hundungensis TaxID=1077946 RepID=UPI0033C59939